MSGNARPRICFVAHNAFGALSGKFAGHIGGVERQQSFMARWLADRGYPVSILTWDEGALDGEEINGVRVFNICEKGGGVRGVRFFHPRWTGLIRAMRRADAAIYYQNCGECVTGQVGFWCRINKRRFVYSVASDPDVDPSLPEMKTMRERILYRYGLRHADRVVVQTRIQQDRLRTAWGIESVLIPMPGLRDRGREPVSVGAPREGKGTVLWVGRIDETKRLEWLLGIAKLCPDIRFEVVGQTHGWSDYSHMLDEQAKVLTNVTRHGYVPPERLPEFYARASVLCCTSRYEGFPNTFLEAWSYGVPVVSTVDPDDLIRGKKLGIVSESIPGLTNGIRRLLGDAELWGLASVNAREYFLARHSPETVMPQFEDLFVSMVEGRNHVVLED